MENREKMKVKELIEKLSAENPEAIVCVASDNFELNHAKVQARDVKLFRGELRDETFTDAFDMTDYKTEVVNTYFRTQDFVQIV